MTPAPCVPIPQYPAQATIQGRGSIASRYNRCFARRAKQFAVSGRGFLPDRSETPQDFVVQMQETRSIAMTCNKFWFPERFCFRFS
jgi:hypothetical protein